MTGSAGHMISVARILELASSDEEFGNEGIGFAAHGSRRLPVRVFHAQLAGKDRAST